MTFKVVDLPSIPCNSMQTEMCEKGHLHITLGMELDGRFDKVASFYFENLDDAEAFARNTLSQIAELKAEIGDTMGAAKGSA